MIIITMRISAQAINDNKVVIVHTRAISPRSIRARRAKRSLPILNIGLWLDAGQYMPFEPESESSRRL